MLVEKWADDTKSLLVKCLKGYAIKHGMTQKDMAYLLETSQPRISDLLNEKLNKFSLDQLLKWSYTLGLNVTIQINQ